MQTLLTAALLVLWTIISISVSARPAGSNIKCPSRRGNNSSSTPTAHVRNGTYHGKYIAPYNQDAFLGIPFAQPPVGDLRFRPPQSLNTSWQDSRNATEYGPACIGYGEDTYIGAANRVSEDCLTLNIIRPSSSVTGPLPVAVWIYGGGFFEGSSLDPRYNLSFIVDQSVRMGKPMVGVSINYRLHGWGFLWSREVVEAGVANLGLRDQRLALHWLQENVEAFGGDPEKVTIWGESAGGISVGMHMLAYDGRDDGLFRGAIAESGPMTGVGLLNPPTELAERLFSNITRDTGCGDVQDRLGCLRSLSAEKLNATLSQITGEDYYVLYFGPLVDGDILVRGATDQLLDGSYVKVPYLLGENSDDGTDFDPVINTDDEFATYFQGFGFDNDTLSELTALYPNTPEASQSYIPQSAPYEFNETIGRQHKRAATILGDMFFKAPRRLVSQVWTKQQSTNTPLYSYRFNAIPNGIPAWLGVTHWVDVPFVFHNIRGDGFPGEQPPYFGDAPFADRPQSFVDLSTLMSRMWVSFVHDQDPNLHGQDGVVSWPGYSVDRPLAFVFDANVTSYLENDTYRGEEIGYFMGKYVAREGVWGEHDLV